MRSRIGMVPQDDVVHRQLTVNQALGYAAELRLPPDTSKAEREQVVAQVLEELEHDQARRHPGRQALRRSAQTRVGGTRAADRAVAADSRRADLRSGPGAGPPGDDDAAPARGRRPRGAGRHALGVLSGCLRPDPAARARRQDGVPRPARSGRGRDGNRATGPTSSPTWAPTPTRPTAGSWSENKPRRQCAVQSRARSIWASRQNRLVRQLSTIARRQIRLVISDRGYTIFLALLPFLIGALTLTVKGPGNDPDYGIGSPIR